MVDNTTLNDYLQTETSSAYRINSTFSRLLIKTTWRSFASKGWVQSIGGTWSMIQASRKQNASYSGELRCGSNDRDRPAFIANGIASVAIHAMSLYSFPRFVLSTLGDIFEEHATTDVFDDICRYDQLVDTCTWGELVLRASILQQRASSGLWLSE